MTVSELLVCLTKNCKAIMIPYSSTTTILWDLLDFQPEEKSKEGITKAAVHDKEDLNKEPSVGYKHEDNCHTHLISTKKKKTFLNAVLLAAEVSAGNSDLKKPSKETHGGNGEQMGRGVKSPQGNLRESKV